MAFICSINVCDIIFQVWKNGKLQKKKNNSLVCMDTLDCLDYGRLSQSNIHVSSVPARQK